MDTTHLCPSCGQPLAPNAPQGLCPACLMKAGFPTGSQADPNDPAQAKAPRFTPPKPAELVAHFPQLEILEFVGQGGMGAVYKARQKQLDRVVALKILPPGIGHDAAFAERFVREAKALAKLNHPSIVTLYEFGQADGLFYFLMEFVDGVNLRQLLNAGRVAPREALAIVPQICDALQYAHDHGIVHRDIKPENILLDRTGRVKVADFGLAKLVGTEALTRSLSHPMGEGAARAPGEGIMSLPSTTEAGQVIGTPQYMAPEQVNHPQEVDHRADIYSLGVVFYQMLTGELPGRRIEPPSKKVVIDVRLDEVVLRALEKEPELRYQTAAQFKTVVETISSSASPGTGTAPSPARPAATRGRLRAALVVGVLVWLFVAGTVTLITWIRPESWKVVAVISCPLKSQPGRPVEEHFKFTASMIELIRSDVILGRVIDRLKLDERSGKLDERWGKRNIGLKLTKAQAMVLLKRRLDVRSEGGTLIQVGVFGKRPEEPEEAMDIANTIAEELRAFRIEQHDSPADMLEMTLRATAAPDILLGLAAGFVLGLLAGGLVLLRGLSRRGPQASPVRTAVETVVATPKEVPNAPETRSDWTLWSPFQPQLVREISAHMTEAEKREATKRSVLNGLWKAGTIFGPFFSIQFVPSPLGWIYGICILVVGLSFLPLWRKMEREFLCTTAWARQQGLRPHQLKGFAVSGGGSAASGARPAPATESAEGRAPSPPPSASESADFEDARAQVNGPAIGLLIVGILNWLATPLVVLTFLFWSFRATTGHAGGPNVEPSILPLLLLFAAIGLVAAVLSTLMIVAALKMKRLSAYGLAITASILAIISPVCLIGLPIGIWALIVLMRPEVRDAFEANNARRVTIAKGTDALSPPRFSRTAIVGACCALLPFVTAVAMLIGRAVWAAQRQYFGQSGPNLLGVFLWCLLLLSLPAPFGTTILGWVAVSQIRRSAGKLCGLGLAVFDGLLFPLVALDAMIGGATLIGLRVAAHQTAAGEVGQGWTAPWWLVLLVPVLMVAVDFLIVRAAWRAAKKPASGSGGSYAVPPGQAVSSGGAWKVVAVIVAVVMLLLFLAIPVGVVFLAWQPVSDFVVHGAVTDAVTGKPIVGARVDDNRYGAGPGKAPQQTWTDANGRYELRTSYEEHTIAASAPGYETRPATLLTKTLGRERETRMDFQLQPTNAPSALTFGPVIERVIQARQTGTNSFLNLDTGQLLTPPPDVTNALVPIQPADQVERFWQGLDIMENTRPFRYIAWLRESGADLMFNGNGQVIAFDGNFAIAHGESSSNWDDWAGLSPEMTRAALETIGSATRNTQSGTTMITLSPSSVSYTSAMRLASRYSSGLSADLLTREQSATWFFKTRNGCVGILQITGFTENPHGVKIRYKLVQAGSGTNASARQGATNFQTAPVTRGELSQVITATGTLNPLSSGPAKWQIVASVAEADIAMVEAGQNVSFSVDAFPNRRFTGGVVQVGNTPVKVENVVTYDTLIEVNDAEPKFKPGMTANVSIIVAHREDVLKIPNVALRFRPPGAAAVNRERGPERTVYVLPGSNESTPEPVRIRTGISDGAFTEVIEGLKEDDRVVIGSSASKMPLVPVSQSGPVTASEYKPPLQFSPWILQVLNDPRQVGTNSFLDLAQIRPTGSPVPMLPLDGESFSKVCFNAKWRDGLIQAAREQGLDLAGDPLGSGVLGFDLSVEAAPNILFLDMKPEELMARLASVGSPPAMVSLHATNTPATWLFRTREGVCGLMTIADLHYKHENVSVRYKFLQAGSFPFIAHDSPKPATLQFRLVAQDRSPTPTELWPDPNDRSGQTQLRLLREVSLDDSVVASASATNSAQGIPEIMLRFTPTGGARFKEVTGNNIGHRLAIVFDGKLLAAPVIRMPVADSAAIAGSFSWEEATTIANSIEAAANKTGVRAPEADLADLRQARATLAELRVRYGEQHPEVQVALGRVRELERMTREEPNASADLREAKARLAELRISFGEEHPQVQEAIARVKALEGK